MVTVLAAQSAELVSDLCGTETILVVDDESMVRNVCAAVLSRAGYRVYSAEGGDLALQMIKAIPSPVHLALLDIRMPKMSGPQLVAELLDGGNPASRDIRFILMSGYTEPDIGPLAERGIECCFLQKPFTAATLLETVRRELDAAPRPVNRL